ncbi:MAG TPA: hypothetical protein VN026_02325 [Bacteroidia bacterium]|jgi:hypothetical protein|nr:hypothetical protein [Bacteroidia bacterium]
MNQQTKVSVISGLVMISIIILLAYYGYPKPKSSSKGPEKNTIALNNNIVNVKANSVNLCSEITPCCFQTNNKNNDRSFNIFGPSARIELQEKMNDYLQVDDINLASN